MKGEEVDEDNGEDLSQKTFIVEQPKLDLDDLVAPPPGGSLGTAGVRSSAEISAEIEPEILQLAESQSALMPLSHRNTLARHETTLYAYHQEAQARLILVNGPGAGLVFPIGAGTFTIGRDPDSHLFLDTDGVSRLHAKIIFDGQRFVVEDQESRNGLMVNDELQRRVALRSGDTLQICGQRISFVQATSDLRPSAQPPLPLDGARSPATSPSAPEVTERRVSVSARPSRLPLVLGVFALGLAVAVAGFVYWRLELPVVPAPVTRVSTSPEAPVTTTDPVHRDNVAAATHPAPSTTPVPPTNPPIPSTTTPDPASVPTAVVAPTGGITEAWIPAVLRAPSVVEVRAAAAGRVTAIRVAAGQRVEPGRGVVAIASAANQEDLIVARENLELARKTGATKSEEALRRRVQELEGRQRAIEVVAPAGGVLQRLFVAPGQAVARNARVAEVFDSSAVRIEVDVAPEVFGTLEPGARAAVRFARDIDAQATVRNKERRNGRDVVVLNLDNFDIRWLDLPVSVRFASK